MRTTIPTAQPGWLASNWKWLLPVGCLGIIVLFVALGMGVVAVVAGSMKSSWAYSEGMSLAASNPEVLRELGPPVTAGWFMSGSISVSGPSGEADIAIPLRGAKTNGTLYVVATKTAGKWSFELAEVEIVGRPDRIDLLRGSRDQVSNNQLNLTVTSLACASAAPAG